MMDPDFFMHYGRETLHLYHFFSSYGQKMVHRRRA